MAVNLKLSKKERLLLEFILEQHLFTIENGDFRDMELDDLGLGVDVDDELEAMEEASIALYKKVKKL